MKDMSFFELEHCSDWITRQHGHAEKHISSYYGMEDHEVPITVIAWNDGTCLIEMDFGPVQMTLESFRDALTVIKAALHAIEALNKFMIESEESL